MNLICEGSSFLRVKTFVSEVMISTFMNIIFWNQDFQKKGVKTGTVVKYRDKLHRPISDPRSETQKVSEYYSENLNRCFQLCMWQGDSASHINIPLCQINR